MWSAVHVVDSNISYPIYIRTTCHKNQSAAEALTAYPPSFTNDDAVYALKLAAVVERGGSEYECERVSR
ncbi:hypothetical protein GCM10007856_28180 [Azospirillum oryzae]|nr:hypothetical protein GCM10007856_28180 [Azospirillum oryzae]